MTFRVGQKVCCVDAKARISLGRDWINNDPPIEGRIYTIEDILFEGDEESLILVEQKRHPECCWSGYASRRFRPLISRTTDISFTEGAPKDSEQFDNRRKVGVEV